MVTMSVDWAQVRAVRASIKRSEASLARHYEARAELMRIMAAEGMSQRQVAAYWGISQVAVLKTMRRHSSPE
jgi:hypothetical protein